MICGLRALETQNVWFPCEAPKVCVGSDSNVYREPRCTEHAPSSLRSASSPPITQSTWQMVSAMLII